MSALTSKKQIILKYIAILLMIICSGTMIYYQNSRASTMCYAISVVFLYSDRRINFNSSFFFLVGFLLLILFSSFFNGTGNISSINTIVLHLFITYFLISALDYREFKSIFLNIVTILSITSIIIFFWVRLFTVDFVIVETELQTMRTFLFHTVAWGSTLLDRVSGIFSEPGAYQFVLNFALILHLEDFVLNHLSKKEKLKIIVIVGTLFLCGSTTGYIVFMLMASYWVIKFKSKRKFLLFPIILLFFSLLFYSMIKSERVEGKFRGETTQSFEHRSADTYALYKTWLDSPFYGHGLKTMKLEKKAKSYGDITSGNGILYAMASLGILWLFLYLFISRLSINKMYKTTPWWFVTVLLILIQMNENFTFKPFIYMFVFQYRSYLCPSLKRYET